MNELKELFKQYNLNINIKENWLDDLKKITNSMLFDNTNKDIYIEGFLHKDGEEEKIAHIIFFDYVLNDEVCRHFIVVNHDVSEERLMRIRKIKFNNYKEIYEYKNNPNMLSRHFYIKRENILMTGNLEFDGIDNFYYSVNRFHEKINNTYIKSLVFRIKTIMENHYFTYDKLRFVTEKHQAEEKILKLLNQHEIPEYKFKILLEQNSYMNNFYKSYLLHQDLQKSLIVNKNQNKTKL